MPPFYTLFYTIYHLAVKLKSHVINKRVSDNINSISSDANYVSIILVELPYIFVPKWGTTPKTT